MRRRTALFAIAVLALAWPTLVTAQSTALDKEATIHVYEGPN